MLTLSESVCVCVCVCVLINKISTLQASKLPTALVIGELPNCPLNTLMAVPCLERLAVGALRPPVLKSLGPQATQLVGLSTADHLHACPDHDNAIHMLNVYYCEIIWLNLESSRLYVNE